MAALVNVTEVFEAWLDRRKRRVGPVATDGDVVTSYGTPLLARGPGPRYFLAERSSGARQTATHLYSLHQLVERSGIDPDLVLKIPIVDVGCAACGGAAAEEVVIRHVDAVHGKFSRNPPSQENPRGNVTTVFEAWLAGKSKTVGPVSTDGATIKSYAMPLLTRQGNRIFLARQRLNVSKIDSRWQPVDRLGRVVSDDLINADGQGYSTKAGALDAARTSGYSMTTTQHLSSLHELVRKSHMENVLEVAAEDVKRATWGGGSLEEVIIKYVDIPGGRIGKGNPAITPTERFRELVLDPDPAAMLVAEDVVIQHHLSLADLGQQWERETNKMVGTFQAGMGEDADTGPPMAQPDTGGLRRVPSRGVFLLLNPSSQLPTWIGWNVHRFADENFEIELVYMLWGQKLDRESNYTAAIGHVTYYETLSAARRQAAADCWAVAKVLKRIATMPGGLGLPDREQVRQTLIDALFAPDKTAPAFYGGLREEKKWGKFDRPTRGRRPKEIRGNPSSDVVGSRLDALELAVDVAAEVIENPRSAFETDKWRTASDKLRSAAVVPKKNPGASLPPGRVTLAWYVVTWRDELGRTNTSREAGRTPAEARDSLLRKFPHFVVLHVAPMGEDLGGWHPPDDPRWLAFEEKERRRLKRSPKKNPGELDRVRRTLNGQIVKGVAAVLKNSAVGDADRRYWTTHQTQRAVIAAHDLLERIVKAEGVESIVDLYALAMEIDTGEPFAYEIEKRPEPALLFDSARGRHIPRDFAAEIRREHVRSVDGEAYEILARGDEPGNDAYWDVWQDVMDHAVLIDGGVEFRLEQTENGDVFMVPSGMVSNEDPDESGSDEYWIWDDLPLAEQFGQSLAHMALADGQSWFDDHKRKSDDGRMEWQPAIPYMEVGLSSSRPLTPDGFTWTFDAKQPAKAEHIVTVYTEEIIPGEEDDDEPEYRTREKGEFKFFEEDGGLDDGSIVTQVVKFILDDGAVEASSSAWHKGIWYTQQDSEQGRDYFERGIMRRDSYHLKGFTEEEERAIYEELTS